MDDEFIEFLYNVANTQNIEHEAWEKGVNSVPSCCCAVFLSRSSFLAIEPTVLCLRLSPDTYKLCDLGKIM